MFGIQDEQQSMSGRPGTCTRKDKHELGKKIWEENIKNGVKM